MFHRIVVPVDLTAKSQLAVAGACRQLAAGGELLLLHVVEKLDDDAPEIEAFYALLERRARAALAELAERARTAGAVARTEVTFGRRVEEILAAVDREGAELVVLASHRVDPQRPFAEGLSMSYRVALLAPCPVLLVK